MAPPNMKSNYGVTVTGVGLEGVGVLVGVGDLVTVGVRVGEGVAERVAVREAVGVRLGVMVGRGVGASPSIVNWRTSFQSSPTKICTS